MSTADVQRLVCKNFRSYRVLTLNIASKFVVFYGENGAGKTNILEAISMFSSDRGLRRAQISDLNTIGSKAMSWNLDMVIVNNNHKTFFSTNVQNGRRIAKIDNALMPSLSKFEEIMWILWVIPSMNNIFITSASERRSFFDHLVSGYDKGHKANLKKLVSLQKERLHVMLYRKDKTWLNILEEEIAEKSIIITKTRLEFINLLHEMFNMHVSDFLCPKIDISGEIERIYSTYREEDAVVEVASLLQSSRYDDMEKQTTQFSVQKSFWHTLHPKSNLDASNCSTGEQKAFLISLIIAVVRIYKNNRFGVPVLLLDDLMVHLDQQRRNSLIQELSLLNVQTFFTGNDLSLFDDILHIAQIYNVKNSICTLQNNI